MAIYQLHEGDELDFICWQQYGDLPGALEAVLRSNWEKLHLFDELGRVRNLSKMESITLPELKRPTSITGTIRMFD
jgi:phage tail protein X